MLNDKLLKNTLSAQDVKASDNLRRAGRSKTYERTRNLVFIALTSALIAAMSQIAIPLPTGMPLTLQIFAIAFAAYLLGVKRGVAAVAVYIMIGAAGAPVFANFTGGIGKILGVTGGFIWGFLPLAMIAALPNMRRSAVVSVTFGLAGLFVCHLLGAAQFALVAGTNYMKALLTVSAPFIAKDVLCVVLAYIAAKAVNARIRV